MSMSEKQFDSFDERFREAAEQYQPPLKEDAWKKMETLLDAQEKKRRRPLAGFWWITDAIMIGIVLYLVLTLAGTQKNVNSHNNKFTDASGTSHNTATQPVAKSENNFPATPNDQAIVSDSKNVSPEQPKQRVSNNGEHSLFPSFSQNSKATGINTVKNENVFSNDNYESGKNVTANKNTSPGEIIIGKESPKPAPQNEDILKANAEKAQPVDEKNNVASVDANKTKVANSETTKQKDEKKTFRQKSGFSLSLAAGPEWSYVWGNKPGAATLTYGGSIGYKFSKRWAVQAGLYSTRKKYEAGKGDYKPKRDSYYYNLTINSVDANCAITEIPISVSYIIQQGSKHSLYASAGFSTLIMKEEKYDYDYLRNGQPAYYSYTYNTNNIQPFAGLLLSGGYSRKISDGLSIAGEPFIKIPLYGVGEGSVKIGSLGMLLRMQYDLPSLRKQK